MVWKLTDDLSDPSLLLWFVHGTCNLHGQRYNKGMCDLLHFYCQQSIGLIIPSCFFLAKIHTSVRLAATDFADLFSALDPAMCRGMYQSRK